jgi:hypothetical protein
MDEADYHSLCDRSSDLFKNRLVLPVAWAVLQITEDEATVSASEIRVELGGRVENNQIRDALKRLERIGALRELPHTGPPSPHIWVRQGHPVWDFVKAWAGNLLSGDPQMET